MQHTIRLPTQPSDDGWDRLFGEAVYGVGGDVGVGGEAQVQFAVDHAILVGVNGNWCISLIHANDTNRLSSQ